MAHWPTIIGFADAVTAAGGKLPAPVATVIATRAAITAWKPPASRSLADVVARGELTPDTADDVLTAALMQPTHRPEDIVAMAHGELARRAAALIRDTADELVTSLRKPHAAAVEKLAKAAKVVDHSTSAEQALEREGGAQAWRELAEARQVLDTIDRVVGALVRDFRLCGGLDSRLPRSSRHAALYAADASALRALCAALDLPSGTPTRGGRWHFVPGVPQLQKPADALALLDGVRQAADEAAAAHLARVHGVLK